MILNVFHLVITYFHIVSSRLLVHQPLRAQNVVHAETAFGANEGL